MALLSKDKKKKKDSDKPFWEKIWDEWCCCSEAYRRHSLIEGLLGKAVCNSSQQKRLEDLKAAKQPYVITDDLPENNRMLRSGQKAGPSHDKDRLTYVVDGEGIIIDAYYG